MHLANIINTIKQITYFIKTLLHNHNDLKDTSFGFSVRDSAKNIIVNYK